MLKVRAAMGIVTLLLACPVSACGQIHPVVDIQHTAILADAKSQALFDEAWDWSSAHQLETGGCFEIQDVVSSFIQVTSAVERVSWRREDYVQLDCSKGQGIWHTHFKPEGERSVGCNIARGQDIYLMEKDRPLGVVVCGKGPAYVIPYTYSARADSLHTLAIRNYPGLKEKEDSLRKETDGYHCSDESRASRERPALTCKEK